MNRILYMESRILYNLFKSYGIHDVLPIVQSHVDKYKSDIAAEFRKKMLDDLERWKPIYCLSNRPS